MENSDKALDRGAKRVYDVAPSAAFAEFMSTGWAPTPLTGIHQDEVIAHCIDRREKLSAAFYWITFSSSKWCCKAAQQ